jgi:hypothetical protein
MKYEWSALQNIFAAPKFNATVEDAQQGIFLLEN